MLAARRDDRLACAALDKFPGISLEIDGRRPLTCRPRAGCAVVLTLQRDAEALFLMSSDRSVSFRLRQRRGGGDGSERARHGASEDERTDDGFCGHISLHRFDAPSWARTLCSQV